jgi:hypothetical protein
MKGLNMQGQISERNDKFLNMKKKAVMAKDASHGAVKTLKAHIDIQFRRSFSD